MKSKFTILAIILVLTLACGEKKQSDEQTAASPQDSTQSAATAPETAERDSTEAKSPEILLADSLFAKGNDFVNRQQCDSAIVCFEKAGTLYEAEVIWEKSVICYTRMGNCCIREGKFGEARKHLDEALRKGLAKLGEHHIEIAELYNNFAYLSHELGDMDETLQFLNKALETSIKVVGEYHPRTASRYNNLGAHYWKIGNFDKALSIHEKALAIRLELGEPLDGSYSNLGIVYASKGDYDQALSYHEKALAIGLSRYAENHPRIANIYNDLGGVYYRKGTHERALFYFEKAFDIWQSALGNHHPHLAVAYNNIGAVYYDLKKYDHALKSYNTAIAIWNGRYGERHVMSASNYANIGELYQTQGKHALALSYREKALDIFKANLGGNHPDVAQAYHNLATTHSAMGNYAKAIETFHHAISSNLVSGGTLNEVSEALFEKVLAQNILLESLLGLARAWAKHGSTKPTESDTLPPDLRHYQLASRLIDHMRTGFRAEGSKLNLAQNAEAAYGEAIVAALRHHRARNNNAFIRQSYEFIEKNKMGILLESLSESQAKQFAGIPDSLLEKERQLRIDLAFYDRSLTEEQLKREQADSTKVSLWQDKVFDFKQDYDALLVRFEKDFPDYYNLKYQTKTVSVQDVQQMLDDNTALVEYFTGQDSIFIFTIAKEAFDVVAVAKDSLFRQRVEDFRTAIVGKDFDSYTRTAFQLYQTLIASVEDRLTAEHLIIVPDAEISTVPFEALLTEQVAKGKLQNYAGLPYLIDDFAISYAYSATLLLEMQKKQHKPAKNDYLAFAPVFPDGLLEGTRGADLLEENIKSDSLRTASRLRSYLPATRKEVTGIEKVFSDKKSFFDWLFGGTSQVYLEQEANEPNLKAPAVRDYRYVHFATHGFVNEQNPKLSGLLLASEQDSTAHEDGIVHLSEIYNLNLNAELVVLSACETGLGQIAKGEGIIGLARGFLYAGAKNLLVSLWQVSDVSTADLMVDFYDNMLDGADKARALRQAKLRLIQSNPEYAKPYNWAPFVLVGR